MRMVTFLFFFVRLINTLTYLLTYAMFQTSDSDIQTLDNILMAII